MFVTRIYRSRITSPLAMDAVLALGHRARESNISLGVTGVLLFDGVYFLQVLEGPEAQVCAVFERLRSDARHCNLVTLLHDFAPRRRFGPWGMAVLDLRSAVDSEPRKSLREWLEDKCLSSPGDRALKILRAFMAGSWRGHMTEAYDPALWTFETRSSDFAQGLEMSPDAPCQFALQPIVDTVRGEITSLEALMRGPMGASPQACFAAVGRENLHQFDLQSKLYALELAAQLGMGPCKLAINLLPMSLVLVPNAVDLLIAKIDKSGLRPEQVVVEVTEEEAITHLDSFLVAMKRLRAVGISLAIDDFGAGYAGLSLLAKFQPEKLKIDRSIVEGIHANGPRQAIVRSIVEFCASLGISTVAEGVETVDEWCWLQAAGVDRFQGYLFARPMLNGVPPVHWPRPVAPAAVGWSG